MDYKYKRQSDGGPWTVINENENKENSDYKLKIQSSYTFLDSLSKYFDLFIIILISEEDNQENILKEFNDVIEDKIILKHVRTSQLNTF